MNKREKLEKAGWKVGSISNFLELTPEENSIVELRLALSKALKIQREQMNLTQNDFAKRLQSSQSRIAKMEAGDTSVSFDLLIRGLLASGIDKKKLGKIVAES